MSERLRQQLELISLVAILLFVGTGLYTQFPGLAYIPVLSICAMLITNKNFLIDPLRYIERNMVYGFIILNSFLLLQMMLSRMDPIDFAFQFFAISLMMITYASIKIIMHSTKKNISDKIKFINFAMLISLIVMFGGQIAQITGHIESRNFEEAEKEVLITVARPGGFLNPNETAAIVITLLFVIDRMRLFSSKSLYSISTFLGIVIILLTQSRASIIALVIFLGSLILRISTRTLIIYTIIFFTLLYFIVSSNSDEIIELVLNNIDRFSGDSSSDERINNIYLGLREITDSPLFGHGNRYLAILFGQSSHNQIIEILINYGILGLFIFILIIYFLYTPISLSILIFCIFPMFIFSHNFFDSAAYQVTLGLALILDRLSQEMTCFQHDNATFFL